MIRVLVTGWSRHLVEIINCLKDNPDKESIYVVGVNCSEAELPRTGSDKRYVVPRSDDPGYIDALLEICIDENIDILFPYVTSELELMAESRYIFNAYGVKVAISSKESISVLNSKEALAMRYPCYMPKQRICRTVKEVMKFAKEVGYPEKKICCKTKYGCGGAGFCIVDEEKANNIFIFNKFGIDRYIDMGTLLDLVYSQTEDLIIQEYEEGYDYSLCVLADKGEIIHSLGMKALQSDRGAAVNAVIEYNEQAECIAKAVAKDTGLEGNACFDFRIKHDGSTKLLEVNPRLSASLAFIAKAGLNLPYLRCRQLLGDNVRAVFPDINYDLRMNKYYVSEYFV